MRPLGPQVAPEYFEWPLHVYYNYNAEVDLGITKFENLWPLQIQGRLSVCGIGWVKVFGKCVSTSCRSLGGTGGLPQENFEKLDAFCRAAKNSDFVQVFGF